MPQYAPQRFARHTDLRSHSLGTADGFPDPAARKFVWVFSAQPAVSCMGTGCAMVRRTCPQQLSAGNVEGAADGDPGEQTVGRVPDVFKRVTGEPRRCFFKHCGWLGSSPFMTVFGNFTYVAVAEAFTTPYAARAVKRRSHQ